MPALTERSARRLARAIRRAKLTASEVVEAHIELLERRRTRDQRDRRRAFREARGDARAADQRIAKSRCAAQASTSCRRCSGCRSRSRRRSRSRGCRIRPAWSRAAAPRAAHSAPRSAADRRRRDPARRHQHLGADAVDRVREPPVRADQQPLRPVADGGRVLRWRGSGGRIGWLALRARRRTSPARSGSRRCSAACSATSPPAGLVPNTGPVAAEDREAGRMLGTARWRAVPRT